MAETAAVFPAERIWQHLQQSEPWEGDWLHFRHSDQGHVLDDLARKAPFDIHLRQQGVSTEYRALWTVRLGRGPRRVLIWARQHGNEPDCTAALAMALDELITRADEPVYERILDRCELLVLPMVNPDGANRFTRCNALGIDLNRDAMALATTEARALVDLKDSFQPEFAFNLHDMGPRKATPDGGLVALALQAGPFQKEDIDNEVRLKAKTVIGEMAAAASVKAPGHIAKYAASYMPRAFGDSMMRWGVACILIESGGWFPGQGGDDFVRRLHALALLSGLDAIARGADAPASGTAYEAIPFDSGPMYYDSVLAGGSILDGGARLAVRSDVAINAEHRHRRLGDHRVFLGTVEAVGDLEDSPAKDRRSAAGSILTPGMIGVSPETNFGTRIPTAEDVRHFLRAGVTTLAASFGPFESREARSSFLTAARVESPPMHLLALERVEGLAEVIARHGMTELGGMAVTGLSIAPQDLIDFIHLYHPAHHSAVPESEADELLGLELVFRGGASPLHTRLQLVLFRTSGAGSGDRTRVDVKSLHRFADEFLRHPDQMSFCRCGVRRMPEFLPITVSPVALGGTPESVPEDFLGRVLRRYGKGDEGSIATLVSLISYQVARALRLPSVGLIRMGYRADLLLVPERVLAPATEEPLFPDAVMLNGEFVLDRARGIDRPGRGEWHFATGAE
ncbi:hypothetical protein HZA57_10265 [Candidatus Poribacteria bacterium]|nr:hypothetical protein [Candidatus Poribacteria bacterium]